VRADKNPFDNLDDLRIGTPLPGPIAAKQRPEVIRRPSRVKLDGAFVRLPYSLLERLPRGDGTAMLAVVMELAYRAWKAEGKPVALPNASLDRVGISRKSKRRVLAQLERAGLVTVTRNGRKSPQVVVHWAGLYPNGHSSVP
jgi:hypothetical protein